MAQAEVLPFADGVSRSVQIFVAGLLGDQQEGDKYTGENCVCHRCKARRNSYLLTKINEREQNKKKKCNQKHCHVGCRRPKCEGRSRYFFATNVIIVIMLINVIIVIMRIILNIFSCRRKELGKKTKRNRMSTCFQCFFGWFLIFVLI